MPSATLFQSSTRQTDFATAVAEVGGHVLQAVSILYEADRLCNRAPALNVALRTEVSILYEADRLCNAGRTLGGATPSTCFNPLRGRQTLQLWRWPRPPPWLGGFNPLRGRQTLQPWPRWRRRRSPQRFNPLRGRQTLQPPVPGEVGEHIHHVSILYEADRLCNEARCLRPGPLE